jgi:hypothetical protein
MENRGQGMTDHINAFPQHRAGYIPKNTSSLKPSAATCISRSKACCWFGVSWSPQIKTIADAPADETNVRITKPMLNHMAIRIANVPL